MCTLLSEEERGARCIAFVSFTAHALSGTGGTNLFIAVTAVAAPVLRPKTTSAHGRKDDTNARYSQDSGQPGTRHANGHCFNLQHCSAPPPAFWFLSGAR